MARTLEILEQVVGSEATENLVKNGHKVTQQGFWRDGKLTKMTETWDCDSQYNYVSLVFGRIVHNKKHLANSLKSI